MVALGPAVRRRFASVDWGFTNPGVIKVWVTDGDNRMYNVHEVYRSRHTIDWWTAEAVKIHAHFKLEAFVCDPAEPGHIQQFVNAGLPAIKANNAIMIGIGKVQERLKVADDGRARMFFYNDALKERDEALVSAHKPASTIDEFGVYVWPKGASGKALKEKPIDADNHGMDDMRYATMYIDDDSSGWMW